jgi:hypothetical protein
LTLCKGRVFWCSILRGATPALDNVRPAQLRFKSISTLGRLDA